MIEPATAACPYCGEPFTTLAEASVGDQIYVEDCTVCCRPIEVRLRFAQDGTLEALEVAREDD